MVTSPYELKIREWDDKLEINKQTNKTIYVRWLSSLKKHQVLSIKLTAFSIIDSSAWFMHTIKSW